MSKELTPKQQRFVDEYLCDLNATKAAERAGYSRKTANEQGARLLANVSVRAAIAAAQKARQERTHITADGVLRELSRIVHFDPRKLFDASGKPIPINELDDDTAAAIVGLDVMEEYIGSGEDRQFVGYTKKYKVADKNTAITNAMKHLGILTERIGNPDGTPLQVAAPVVNLTLNK